MNLPLYAVSVSARPPAAAVVLTVLPFVVLLLLVLIASSVLRRPSPSFPGTAAPSATGREDDRYWFAGLIYVNPNDAALLVKKRRGPGRTLNFGHWASWLITTTLLSIPLLLQFVVGHRVHH